MTRELTPAMAQAQLTQLIAEVNRRRHPITITPAHGEAVVLVPLRDWEAVNAETPIYHTNPGPHEVEWG